MSREEPINVLDSVDEHGETSAQPEPTEHTPTEIPGKIESEKEIGVVDETPADLTKLPDDLAVVPLVPEDVAEPVVEDEKTSPETESTKPAAEEIPKEIEVQKEIVADLTDSLIDETLTDPMELSKELAEQPMEQKLDSGDSEEPSVQPLQASAAQAETSQPVISEITSGDDTSKSEVKSKEETGLEETAISFVTPRTPPSSRMDVQFYDRAEDSPDVIEQASDYLDEALIRSEQLELGEAFIIIKMIIIIGV